MDDMDITLEQEPVEIDNAASEVHPLDWDCPEKLKLIIEGALFGTSERLTPKSIQVLFPDTAKPNLLEIKDILSELQQDYTDRAVQLHESTLGYRFQVRQEATPLIKSMLTEKPPKYSRASMETLALIAYRQPITRGEIEEIRGVSVSSQIMRTMEEREWIRIVGHKELPGRPALWATTPVFLDYFGLASLEDLPPLAEIESLESFEKERQNATSGQKSETMEVDTLEDEVVDSENRTFNDLDNAVTITNLLTETENPKQAESTEELQTQVPLETSDLDNAEISINENKDQEAPKPYQDVFNRLRNVNKKENES